MFLSFSLSSFHSFRLKKLSIISVREYLITEIFFLFTNFSAAGFVADDFGLAGFVRFRRATSFFQFI